VPKLVLKETPYFKPNVINGTMNGNNVYRTNDLLQRHPRDPNLWRVFGRADDQLMLSTGEKVIYSFEELFVIHYLFLDESCASRYAHEINS